MTVKLAIIYYSTYGTNHRMAELAAEAESAMEQDDLELREALESSASE